MLTISGTVEGLKDDKKIIDIDINDGLKTVANIKITIDKDYISNFKELESVIKRYVGKLA